MTPSDAMTPAMSDAGTFISLAQYESQMSKIEGPVVLFFNASWCPDCQAMVKAIKADPAVVPAGVTLVDVDFDKATDLRKKYGVTMQHTFVQIDADGMALNKWSATKAEKIGSGIKS